MPDVDIKQSKVLHGLHLFTVLLTFIKVYGNIKHIRCHHCLSLRVTHEYQACGRLNWSSKRR